MTRYATHATARHYLAHREPFRNSTGSFWAVEGATAGTGHLPREWADTFATHRDKIVYTVVSHRTPIAWILANGERVIPNVRHSVTTSRHQGQVRAWL